MNDLKLLIVLIFWIERQRWSSPQNPPQWCWRFWTVVIGCTCIQTHQQAGNQKGAADWDLPESAWAALVDVLSTFYFSDNTTFSWLLFQQEVLSIDKVVIIACPHVNGAPRGRLRTLPLLPPYKQPNTGCCYSKYSYIIIILNVHFYDFI